MSDGPATGVVENPFVTRPVGRLLLSNALPMAVVMAMGGVLNVVDGIFVGRFIGAEALAAVSLAFPVVMVLTALTSLAGGGMSSLLARHLGAGAEGEAGSVFAGAHGLALALSALLIVGALTVGPAVLSGLAAGNEKVARLAEPYLLILVLGTPVQFTLGLHADAMRNEGRAGLIALLSVGVNLLNIGANYVAIVVLGLGVAGSALGTIGAQALGLLLLLVLRSGDPTLLPLSALRRQGWGGHWRAIFALGLPLSLSFIGMALVSATVLLTLGEAASQQEAYVAGYGVATRVLGLAFLPQMAIALTTQSITGHNFGAGRLDRARAALWRAMGAAMLWCLAVSAVCVFAGERLGAQFSNDPQVIAAVGAILAPMTFLYAVTGPILVLALHFQAMGRPGRAALLTLLKPWLLTPVLIVVMVIFFGSPSLWFAFPVADSLLLGAALALVWKSGLSRTRAAAGQIGDAI